jgi:hypothetical protein
MLFSYNVPYCANYNEAHTHPHSSSQRLFPRVYPSLWHLPALGWIINASGSEHEAVLVD